MLQDVEPGVPFGTVQSVSPAYSSRRCFAAVQLRRSPVGATERLRDDRAVRVMAVRDEVPPAVVEWAER
jgi:hypothetical protein